MRLLLTLAGLATGFALPTFAQQKDVVDPELMKAVLHSCQVFDNAFNNNDPEALANLFTEDATFVTDSGVLHGRDDILKYQIGVFKVVHFSSHKNVPISAYPIGTDGKQFWATGSWSHTVQVQGGEPTEQKGFWSAIIVNDGTGKHVMQTWNITPAPAPTTTPSPTSSKEEKNTVDPQLRGQILALVKKFDDAFNNNDPAALSQFYTEDAVLVVPEGPVYGREAIVKSWVDLFQKVRFSNHLCTLDQYSPHMIGTSGNEMWATAGWSQTIEGLNLGVKGYWSGIFVRQGNDWRFRLLAIIPPPPYQPAQTK